MAAPPWQCGHVPGDDGSGCRRRFRRQSTLLATCSVVMVAGVPDGGQRSNRDRIAPPGLFSTGRVAKSRLRWTRRRVSSPSDTPPGVVSAGRAAESPLRRTRRRDSSPPDTPPGVLSVGSPLRRTHCRGAGPRRETSLRWRRHRGAWPRHRTAVGPQHAAPMEHTSHQGHCFMGMDFSASVGHAQQEVQEKDVDS
ncbi:hypothetical protein GUJ93_ZPchr0002g24147 [Zizania palustris]|uniref:Uncharacterized protein n=1 Tax=Zizania palustris TaxID=103762 RepID=A0A8J5RT56_ZIZPA|nr:hypothetical protein GUJ93_ZPchr0002g24147 [Zizania palustris]